MRGGVEREGGACGEDQNAVFPRLPSLPVPPFSPPSYPGLEPSMVLQCGTTPRPENANEEEQESGSNLIKLIKIH